MHKHSHLHVPVCINSPFFRGHLGFVHFHQLKMSCCLYEKDNTIFSIHKQALLTFFFYPPLVKEVPNRTPAIARHLTKPKPAGSKA